jgi:hypothetical protein
MTVIRGGEMAFPLHNTGHGEPYDEGMTLRDYIAIHAMQAIIAKGEAPNPYVVARDSFKIADIMMEHRDSGE